MSNEATSPHLSRSFLASNDQETIDGYMSSSQCAEITLPVESWTECKSKNGRRQRNRNPGISPSLRKSMKSLKKADSFPFLGSFRRLHSSLKDAFPLKKQNPPPLEKVTNRRSSIPGAFKPRRRRSTLGNILNGVVSLSLSPLLGQDEDEDLWYTSVDDFESPIYVLEQSSLCTSYFVKATVCRRNFVLHEYLVASLSVEDEKHIRRAVSFMEWVRHQHIIKCYGAWETDEAIYIVEEYCYRANLMKQIVTNKKSFTEKHIVTNILTPLLDALVYLHSMDIAHRGVFPENIQFSKKDSLRLSGFTYAIDFNKSRPSTRQGPLDYCPPEVLYLSDVEDPVSSQSEEDDIHGEQECNEKIDVWQIGILTYELLNGICPFEVPDRRLTSGLILWTDIHNYPSDFSPGAVDFLKKALHKNPEDRPTMEELAEHSWITMLHAKQKKSSFFSPPSPLKNFSLWSKVQKKLKFLAVASWWSKTKILPNSQEENQPHHNERTQSTSEEASSGVDIEAHETSLSESSSSDNFKIPSNLQVKSILSAGIAVEDFLPIEQHFPY